MFSLGHLRNQLLDYDVHHGAGRKAQKIRKDRHNKSCCKHGDQPGDRFHRAGQRSQDERLRFLHTPGAKRHGYNRAFGKVLNRDADGQCKCGCHRDIARAVQPSRKNNADRHPLRNIVQCNREDQLGRPFQAAFRALFFIVHMHMRRNDIQQQKESHADQKADSGRNKRKLSHVFGFFKRRSKQAPETGRNHDTGCETGQRFLYLLRELIAKQKHHCRSCSCSDKRNDESSKDIRHFRRSFL